MIKRILTLLFFIIIALFLAVALRGKAGNPSDQTLNTNFWKDLGPFELSPERGRFALTYSVIEDKSFYFSLPVAKFATPDLGYNDGHYVSLFAPGVSFLVMPGFILGKEFGLSQVGTFAIIALFALLNAFLVKKIAERLGANSVAANLGAMAFLFGTPAFAYAVSLYQHHVSVFLLLLSVWLLVRFKSLKALIGVWFLLTTSLAVDYPNLFFAIPIAIYSLGRMFHFEYKGSLSINFKLVGILTFIGVVLPLCFFLYVNYLSYNDPFQLAGTVTAVKAIDAAGKPTLPILAQADIVDQFAKPDIMDKFAVSFFKTRDILHGFYVHLFSPDRGVLVYAPVILFGILGLFLLYRKQAKVTALIASIILVNLLLYSMWDDPWGGWAFGSRYLIISYAFLGIGVGYLLTALRKNYMLIGIFALVFTYSSLVNTLGAITSSQNPPQEQVLMLESQTKKEEKYTFARNSVYLLEHGSKSYVYQEYLANLFSPVQFYLGLSALIIMLAISQVTLLQMSGVEAQKPAVKLAKRGEPLNYAPN